MTRQLFTNDGKRKYLTLEEQDQFLAAAAELDDPKARTFCMTLAYTGCRISEALNLPIGQIDLSEKAVRFQSLKKRDKISFRNVPVSDHYLDALKLVHHVQKLQKQKNGNEVMLWDFQRTMGYNHIKKTMKIAGIQGAHATPRGLRHGFGVRMALKTRNPRLIQTLLGHVELETTAIYMDVIGQEARDEVLGAW